MYNTVWSLSCKIIFGRKINPVFLFKGGETVYAQFDIWKANAAWAESANFAAAGGGRCDATSAATTYSDSLPPPYPAYGRPYSAASSGQHQQQQASGSYSDMAYVLQVGLNYRIFFGARAGTFT
jgi:hypothetical protein